MARMFPTTVPRETSAAETQLLSVLATLPEEYHVFHSVRLHKRNQDNRSLDKRGEIDFAVLHPRFGLLLLETKGAKLRRDGVEGAWYSEDAQGVEHEIRDPFVQVDEQAMLLRGFLGDGVRRFQDRVQAGVAMTQTGVGGPTPLDARRHGRRQRDTWSGAL